MPRNEYDLEDYLHSAGFSSGLLLFASFGLTAASLYAPWWKDGRNTAGAYIPWTVKATLWKTDAWVDNMPPLSRVFINSKAPLVKVEKLLDAGTKWDLLCGTPEGQNRLMIQCIGIHICRGTVMLSCFISLISSLVLFFGGQLGSAQILFFGGVLAIAATIFSVMATVVAMMMGTDGLGGAGYLCIGCACLADIAGTLLSTIFLAVEVRKEEALAVLMEEDDPHGNAGTGKEDHPDAAPRTTRVREITNEMLGIKGEAQGPKKKKEVRDIPDVQEFWRSLGPAVDETGDEFVPREVFVKQLVKVAGLPNLKGVGALLDEVDRDGSGTLEHPEFMEFFEHVEALGDFAKKSAMRRQVCTAIMACYLVFTASTTFILTCLEANYEQTGVSQEKIGEIRGFRLMSTGCLFHSIICSMLLPLLTMKCRPFTTHFEKGPGFQKIGNAFGSWMANMSAEEYACNPPPADLVWEQPPDPEDKNFKTLSFVDAARTSPKKVFKLDKPFRPLHLRKPESAENPTSPAHSSSSAVATLHRSRSAENSSSGGAVASDSHKPQSRKNSVSTKDSKAASNPSGSNKAIEDTPEPERQRSDKEKDDLKMLAMQRGKEAEHDKESETSSYKSGAGGAKRSHSAPATSSKPKPPASNDLQLAVPPAPPEGEHPLAPAAPPPRLGYIEGHGTRVDIEHNRKEAMKEEQEDAQDNKKRVGKMSNAYDPRNYRQAKREQKEPDYGASMDLFNTQRRVNPLMQVKEHTMAVNTYKIKIAKIKMQVKKQLTAREAADAAHEARVMALEGRTFDPRTLEASPAPSLGTPDNQ